MKIAEVSLSLRCLPKRRKSRNEIDITHGREKEILLKLRKETSIEIMGLLLVETHLT